MGLANRRRAGGPGTVRAEVNREVLAVPPPRVMYCAGTEPVGGERCR